MNARDDLLRILAENNFDGSGVDPHSWRCSDKGRYPGDCGCATGTVDDLLAWLVEHDAALVAEHDKNERLAQKWMGHANDMLAERDAAREQLRAAEAVFAAIREHYPPLNAELSMRGGEGPFVDKGMEGYIEAFSVVDSILSGYQSQSEPVSSALTERDAEKWDESARAHREGVVMPGLHVWPVNPYRVTPTEEPK